MALYSGLFGAGFFVEKFYNGAFFACEMKKGGHWRGPPSMLVETYYSVSHTPVP